MCGTWGSLRLPHVPHSKNSCEAPEALRSQEEATQIVTGYTSIKPEKAEVCKRSNADMAFAYKSDHVP
jgi:hypothetical protein